MKLFNRNNKDALKWFVGFAEGDGSWQIDTNERHKRSIFVINQERPQVLYKIKELVGYGQVNGPYENKNGSIYYRYRVGNLEGTRRLIEIFNGNLVLKKTQERFIKYLEMYNRNSFKEKQIPLNTNNPLPTLEDAWFSGFIDAEGSFSGTFRRDKSSGEYVRAEIRFSIVQKGENEIFQHLKAIFGGSVQYKKTTDISRLMLSSVKDRNRIIGYLSKYPLHSDKTVPFTRFKKLHVRLTDGKFKWRLESKRAKERLFTLIRNINKDI